MRQKSCTEESQFPPLKPGILRIYSMRWYPYAHRVLLVLAHKRIPHEIVNINLRSKPEWFLKINPLGTVPALQQDEKIVYESHIVADYLDETFPGDKLTPTDPYYRARDRMVIERYSKLVTAFYKIYFSNEVTSDTEDEVLNNFDVLESELGSRDSPYFGGEKVMMIDFILWPHIERLDCLTATFPAITLHADRFPRMRGWINAMKQIPVVQETDFPLDKYLPTIIKANKEDGRLSEFHNDLGLNVET